MKKSRQTKRALIPSILAVIMCVAMLIGTTFAWFTDTASTSVNKIQAGKLDVALEMYDTTENEWVTAEKQILKWKQATGTAGTTKLVDSDAILWEPGCTYELEDVRIINNGNLALKYQIQISGIKGSQKLNEAIEWTMTLDNTNVAENLSAEHSLAAKTTDAAEADYTDTFTIKGHMKEDAGNEYQGLSIEGIAITVSATQDTVEYDSTGNQYDANAALPVNASATSGLSVEKATTTTGSDSAPKTVLKVTTQETVKDSVMSVTYPEGVLLKNTTTTDIKTDAEAGTTGTATATQSLTYEGETVSEKLKDAAATIGIGTTKAVAQYDLVLPVDESNTKLIPITINYTKNLTGVIVYHSGTKLTTTASTTDEYFTYNATTGELVLYLKHASPIDIVYDKPGVTSFTTSNGGTLTVIGGTAGTDYKFESSKLTVLTGTAIKVSTSGTETNPTKMRIVVPSNVSADVTLAGAAFIPNDALTCGIDIEKNGSLTLNLTDGTKNFVQGYWNAGIGVPESASLIIDGTGELTVLSGNNASTYAAIGETASKEGWGTITINNGTVNATSKLGGAGIGGGTGKSDYCDGTIVINGGTVTAKSTKFTGYQGASIGAGQKYGSGLSNNIYCSGGDITITGGTVYAETIGGAAGTDKGNITIGANATILPLTDGGTVTIGSGDGSKIEATEGQAKNTVTDNRIRA